VQAVVARPQLPKRHHLLDLGPVKNPRHRALNWHSCEGFYRL
jgi:hypothetical protein